MYTKKKRLATRIINWIQFFLIVGASSANAFNWEACEEQKLHMGFSWGWYFSTGTSTSIGECALIDSWKIKFGQTFLKQNQDILRTEIVRGDGEYLSSLAGIFSCRPEEAVIFKSNLKTKYKELLSREGELEFSRVNEVAKEHCGRT